MATHKIETTSHGPGCLCGRCGTKDELIAQLQAELERCEAELEQRRPRLDYPGDEAALSAKEQ